MSDNAGDDFPEIFGHETAADRHVSFAWIMLTQDFFELQDHSGNDSLRTDLEDLLKNRGDSRNHILNGFEELAPEHYFGWITNSHRQSSWVEKNIDQIKDFNIGREIIRDWATPHGPALVVPHHLVGRSRALAIIDFWLFKNIARKADKIAHVERIQLAWQRHIRTDKYFNWLDDDKTEKREFFWRWLESKDSSITKNRKQFYTHDELLEFFDDIIFTRADREILSGDARKAWNQNYRRRNNKDKRQCNFVLSEKAIRRLETLALKHGLSRTEIIELIIESEAKNEHYISERLQRKNLLLAPLE